MRILFFCNKKLVVLRNIAHKGISMKTEKGNQTALLCKYVIRHHYLFLLLHALLNAAWRLK